MTAAIPLLARFAVSYGAGKLAGKMDGGSDPSDESPPPQGIPLGNGHYIQFSEEQFRQLLHSQIVVDAIHARAAGVMEICNDSKVIPSAEYEVIIQNRPDSTRARAFVKPANYAAVRDDAAHSTMLKAAANAPNDPKPGGRDTESVNGAAWVDLG